MCIQKDVMIRIKEISYKISAEQTEKCSQTPGALMPLERLMLIQWNQKGQRSSSTDFI